MTTKRKHYRRLYFLIVLLFLNTISHGQSREHLLMDFGWHFALGNSGNFEKDFYSGTSYFTYFAKAGYGDGPASAKFDDRAWRVLNLPHDWAIEIPFSGNASHSHGYINLGWKFPENSVGWYRKSFAIPSSDLGKRISVQFDGIYRNATVWVNGFYLGQEHSGYACVNYDITDYINYGGENIVVVRADATIEEGWFYEGAGIYRHVWLNKTEQLHIADNGTFVSTVIDKNTARIHAATTIINKGTKDVRFDIKQVVTDASGNTIATNEIKSLFLRSGATDEFKTSLDVKNPKLWSLETPYLHQLITSVYSNGKLTDTYVTTFGIRTVRFDANEGFFLNGKHIQLKGTNNHQDHAGIGVALPDAMQEYRIARLKEMGSNAYRCSHNPPTPELLDACDRLGMLVIVENRLMGTNQEHLDLLKRMILLDRNHPSVILWSLGNEEWQMEGNITGARVTSTMQSFAQQIDSTRRYTVAVSGGWGDGISTVLDVMGFNYLTHGSIDDQHKQFPNQPAVGTEESTTSGTRGIYINDKENGHMAATDRTGDGPSIETGWKFYNERPFLAGLFYWTGFDFRGEPNPLAWPAVSSQFGIMDVCGFPKDVFYYLQSVWTNETVLHIFPHWNWKGKEGQEISVWAYSNCEEVELFLNKKSLGKKKVLKNSHVEWLVKYQPGTILAKGFRNGSVIATQQIETTGEPAIIQLNPNKAGINADGEDVSVVTIQLADSKGRSVPTASNELTFTLNGPGKILGIANGDPASHEADQFLEDLKMVTIQNLKEHAVSSLENLSEVSSDFDDTSWQPAFKKSKADWWIYTDSLIVVRGIFVLPDNISDATVSLFSKSIVEGMSIYINGQRIATNIIPNVSNQSFLLQSSVLRPGENKIAITGQKFRKRYLYDEPNTDPGVFQVIIPSKPWKRCAFNGLAQIIIQSTKESGEISLTAASSGLTSATVKIQSKPAKPRPKVD